jgi:hypothetical protein
MTEPARPKRLHGRSQEMFDALKQAGIIRDGDYVRRVVIDINVDSAVIVHVERYGDERLLNVVQMLDGVEIRREQEHQPAQ